MEARSPFLRACSLIGTYSSIGALFDPPISAQGVAKWADAGVPADRVIRVAAATGFRVTPHELRPDLYPHPDDGLPEGLRKCAESPLESLLRGEVGAVLREDERTALSIAFERGPEHAIRAIEALELKTSVRAQLLAAAQREEQGAA